MTATVFVDTNVLVYYRDAAQAEKQRLAASWLRHLWESRKGRLSVQVLNEYYYTVTRKLASPLAPEQARLDVRRLRAWSPVPLDGTLLEAAWQAESRFRLSFWDALVVAAARTAGCRYLLTEDLQHEQDLDGVRVVDPFLVGPEAVAT
jgi:predicted nucleic acid-binding protein